MTDELIFDAATLPEPDRFEKWREMFCSAIWGLEIVHTDARPFHARWKFAQLGAVGVGQNELSAADYIRTPKMARAQDGDDFGFHLNLLGGSGIVQAGRSAEMSGLSGALVTSALPGSVSIRRGQGCSRYQGYCLHIPRLELLQRIPGADRYLLDVRVNTEPLRLLVQYLDLVQSNAAFIHDPELNQLAGNHVLDLIGLLIEPRPEVRRRAEQGGLRAARGVALHKYVEAHYRDEGLTVRSAAGALGISESYLHRLMAESAESFTEMVNRLRLEGAKRMLENPKCDAMRIGEIALAAGFNDFTYFNRLFRRRFGDTPGAFRACRPHRDDRAGR